MILFKLCAVIIAFFIRCTSKYVYRFAKFGAEKTIDGVKLIVKKTTNKNGTVTGTTFVVPLQCKSVFKLTRESWIDQVCKNFGLSTELQTGHTEFDQVVYIASDSQLFLREMQQDAKSRELILKLFQTLKCHNIYCDGETLALFFKGDNAENTEAMNTFVELSKQLADLNKAHIGFFDDPHAKKILIIEALIWSLATFAAISFLDWATALSDVYLYQWLLVSHGIRWGFFVAIVFLCFIAIFLKGSSRGHRILVESFIVLFLSLPVGGIGVVADINSFFDKSKSTIIEAKVTDFYRQEHRSRRSTWYTYHINVETVNSTNPMDLPRSIKVEQELYNKIRKDSMVRIEIGQGYLKHLWYKSIAPLSW